MNVWVNGIAELLDRDTLRIIYVDVNLGATDMYFDFDDYFLLGARGRHDPILLVALLVSLQLDPAAVVVLLQSPSLRKPSPLCFQ